MNMARSGTCELCGMPKQDQLIYTMSVPSQSALFIHHGSIHERILSPEDHPVEYLKVPDAPGAMTSCLIMLTGC